MSAAEVVRLEKEDSLNWLLAPTFSQWSALGEGGPFHHLRTLTSLIIHQELSQHTFLVSFLAMGDPTLLSNQIYYTRRFATTHSKATHV